MTAWTMLVGAGLLAAGALAVTGLVLLRRSCTAAGVELTPPADGAEVAAGPATPAMPVVPAGPDRAASAPGAPVEGAGAPGVLPDPIDAHAEQMAAALLGLDPADQIEAIRCRAVDYLANSHLSTDDEDVAIGWEDRCRVLLADELVPAELVELLIEYMQVDARCRADQLLAGVEQAAGGGR